MKMLIKFDGYRQFPGILSGMILLGLALPGPVSADSHSGKPKMIDLWQPGDSGQRMSIRGRVTSLDGRPVPNVEIGFRHADSEGYDWSYYQGQVVANEKGNYQFGSVIPGNSHRLSHVHVTVDHDGYEHLEIEFYFKHDPKADADNPSAIFLEAGTVNGETKMFGRFDITLIAR
jgi:protocatechuate 3,4-dioxygenase beta subunit